MLSYLFLLAAATTPELPTTNLTQTETQAISSFAKASSSAKASANTAVDTTADIQELQELIAVLAQEIQADANITTELTKEQHTEATLVAAPIIITNAIEPSMLEYKHWTGKYSPEKFAISINGTEIEQGKTCEIPAHTSTVEIEYTYSFINGMKTGGKRISYQLNKDITQANITFNWKDDWRIIVDNGKAVKEIT